jgi:methyltransferase (TIGR00027 family)
MREGHASRTAEYNTLFRALESSRAQSDRLFHDPFARLFLRWPLSFVHKLARLPGVHAFVPWFIDHRWPGVRTSVVARTRFIDDAIAASLNDRIEQFVVLGAGFDSRAYRLPSLQNTALFEVDHPATQAAKRRSLERALHVLPKHVRFVASDFTQHDLHSNMAASGYRESARTFFLWEGVTNYLTEDAVDATLRWCARAAPESILLFTYVHSDIITSPSAFLGTERLFASLEKAGERFTFGIDPSQLREFLSRRGLSLESDVGATEFRARYFGEAARKMRGHEFYRVALARVGARATQRDAAADAAQRAPIGAS